MGRKEGMHGDGFAVSWKWTSVTVSRRPGFSEKAFSVQCNG